MVAQFQLAGGQMFALSYLRGQSAFAYLLIFSSAFSSGAPGPRWASTACWLGRPKPAAPT